MAAVLVRSVGKHMLFAVVDRPLGHAAAGKPAMDSGMAVCVANRVFDMCGGCRHVRAHCAVAKPKVGRHGLVAGCAFAKDILKDFLGQAKHVCVCV